MKVLIVEDDPDIASLLERNFASEAMETVHAATGADALNALRHNIFSAVVLDVMLPDLTGIEICQRLRKQDYEATIIMLSARDTVNDRIEGLSAGADDYVVKPFAFEELLARIHAQQRRRQGDGHGSCYHRRPRASNRLERRDASPALRPVRL